MTTDDKPGKRTGHEGREETAALSDEALYAAAGEQGVSTTNEDGSARDRQEIVNEVANKLRQDARQADKPDKGDDDTDEVVDTDEAVEA